jgi:protein-S-isoprenylcysteine O-methyltransferase Ste14
MDAASGTAGTVASRLIAIAQVAIQVSVGLGLLVGVPLLAAGRLDWRPAWRLAALFVVLLGVNLVVLRRTNREVIGKRMRLGVKPRRWDRNLMLALTFAIVATLVVAGLDARLGWAEPLPGSAVVLGAVLLIVGDLLFLWAMAVNRFFTKLVVIESDKGHSVVDAGPYRLIRHPGYVGWFVLWLGVPLVLASAWALLPGALASGGIVVRAALEDADLAAELPGYREYAARVRYRLLPGVW